jgi:hypothetical protein
MATNNAAVTKALEVRIDNVINATVNLIDAESAYAKATLALFSPVKTFEALKALRAMVKTRYVAKYQATAKKGYNEKMCNDAFDAFWSRATKSAIAQKWVKPKSATKAATKSAVTRGKAAATSPAKVDKRTLNTKANGNKGTAAPNPIVSDSATKIDVGVFRSALDWVLASAERQTLFVAWVDAQKAATTVHKAA